MSCQLTSSLMELSLTNEIVNNGDLATLPGRLMRKLKRGADPNHQDAYGKTALHHLLSIACQERKMKSNASILQTLHTLLKGGASVDVQDNRGQTIVQFAAAENLPSQILFPLLRKCNISQLSVAAIHDLMSTKCLDVDILVTLCRSDVNLLSSVETNITAVHRMIEKHRPADALLVHTLASERSREFNIIKENLLFHACIHGSKETLQALLQLGASVVGKDAVSGLPALLLAASSADDEEAVKKVNVLVANGADMHVTSSNGQTLCHIAAVLRHSRLLELAIAKRVDHTCQDKEGSTPLHYACAAPGNGAVISLLINAGLDVNEQNSDGLTPLSLSISSKHVNNISPLVKAMVDIKQYDLKDCMFQDLQILAQPEIISASPRPLEYTLVLSTFYERMAQEQRRLKESYTELSVELENTAIKMIQGLEQFAFDGDVVEMAISTGRKRFIATDAIQHELLRLWQGRQEAPFIARLITFITFLVQTIARPLVIFFVWPLIVFNIEVYGYSLSWDTVRPRAHPNIRYHTEVIGYVVFFILLLTETITMHHTHRDMAILEWITLIYVLALLHNECVTLLRTGFGFYFTRLGHKWNCLTIALFAVFFIMRFVAIYEDEASSKTILRLSSHILAMASMLAGGRVLGYLRVHPIIGPLQNSFGKVHSHMHNFLVILFIYLLAFASALTNIYAATRIATKRSNQTDCVITESFGSMPSSVRSLFMSLYGLIELDDLKNCTTAEEIVGKVVFALWQIQALTILLNMLIALVTNKFGELQSKSDIEWKFSLAATIFEVQKSRRLPIPFNLLHIFVDLIEWLFNKDNNMAKTFDLLPLLGILQRSTVRRNRNEQQIETFSESEKKKCLEKTVSRGDMVDVNERLLNIEDLVSSVCESLNIQAESESTTSALVQLKRDGWSSYRKRVNSVSPISEYTEDDKTEERSVYKKRLIKRMLEKADSSGTSSGARASVLAQPPTRLQPIVESERTTMVPQSDNLTQALITLQESVQQQGYTLLQIQSQLGNVDNRLKQLESKQSKATNSLQFQLKEDSV